MATLVTTIKNQEQLIFKYYGLITWTEYSYNLLIYKLVIKWYATMLDLSKNKAIPYSKYF